MDKEDYYRKFAQAIKDGAIKIPSPAFMSEFLEWDAPGEKYMGEAERVDQLLLVEGEKTDG